MMLSESLEAVLVTRIVVFLKKNVRIPNDLLFFRSLEDIMEVTLNDEIVPRKTYEIPQLVIQKDCVLKCI